MKHESYSLFNQYCLSRINLTVEDGETLNYNKNIGKNKGAGVEMGMHSGN